MRKPTRAELEDKIKSLEPYVEATICLQRKSPVHTFSSGEGEDAFSIGVIGLERASGGVVVEVNGQPCCAEWLTCYTQRLTACAISPYRREVARKAERAQVEAIRRRVG